MNLSAVLRELYEHGPQTVTDCSPAPASAPAHCS